MGKQAGLDIYSWFNTENVGLTAWRGKDVSKFGGTTTNARLPLETSPSGVVSENECFPTGPGETDG